MSKGVVAIVLAGQRPGPDRVASLFGLRAKALAPLLGRPMIDRMLETLLSSPQVASVLIVEDKTLEPMKSAPGVAAALEAGRAKIVPSFEKITDGIVQTIGGEGDDGAYLVTTADNPLLTPEMIADFLAKAAGSDVAVAMAERHTIEAAYPDIPRTYYQFRDKTVSGANLFYINGATGLKAIKFWSYVEQYRKNPLRISAKFGVANLWLMGFKRLTLGDAFERASEKAGCLITPVVMPHAEAAIDVDKPVDLLIAEAIVARRDLARA